MVRKRGRGKGTKIQYLVRYKGFGDAHDEWREGGDLHAPRLIVNPERRRLGLEELDSETEDGAVDDARLALEEGGHVPVGEIEPAVGRCSSKREARLNNDTANPGSVYGGNDG
ncbi:hypothetical protein TWF481_002838 [Arthrobotrys musiformis]|uniref:Chromo domain-containing protein n=1 Tax=Arthrobotrys musiformis TaxID=47236 RepID=A0AAV9VRE2_9PEZI